MINNVKFSLIVMLLLLSLCGIAGMWYLQGSSPFSVGKATAAADVEMTLTYYLPFVSTPIGGQSEPSEPSISSQAPLVPTATTSFFTRFFDDIAIQTDRPTPWDPSNWEITIHSRDRHTWDALEPMEAHHGPNCEPPMMTHTVTRYEDAVYNCKEHMMTAINAEGYGVIYMTPDHMVDFSQGEAVIRFDVSTLRTSGRDWFDVWITPYEDNLQLPLALSLPDLSGEPRNAVYVELAPHNQPPFAGDFIGHVVKDFESETLPRSSYVGYETLFEPSPKHRRTFELRISKNHIKFGLPEFDFWWVDTEIDLDWDRGVVQFGHHSYNPYKACEGVGGCEPNTYHWDNFEIEPAWPFTIHNGNLREVDNASTVVEFDYPAPEGSHLRFTGIGKALQVSYDDGQTWQAAEVRELKRYKEEHFWSYWMPIPAGVQRVQFRGTDWWGGRWLVREISVWAPDAYEYGIVN